MEVSSHALDQGRVEAIHFDIAVLTNLSRDHLDYHGTMEEYGASKLRLFHMPGLRCVILNMDDPFGHEVLQNLSAGVPAVGYGLRRPELLPDRLDGWIWAEEIETDSDGMQVRLNTSRGDGTFRTALLGRFNVSNLMSVLAVLLFQRVPLSEALQRLSALRTVAGRMERFGGGEQPLVVVDYAHTPDALEHALQAAQEHTAGRLICVFGCGGDRDRGKRPQMGAIAERYADRVIVTDDNPRTEDGDRIVADILAGMDQAGSAKVERDRAAAIRQAVAEGSAGDLVLICGKGHEDYQVVGDQRLHVCDREQVRAALEVAA
jgi:UDP-N-acetylmuramoyl-L-alanyl-D-glutamate--2,6-diaminopimelate ligase